MGLSLRGGREQLLGVLCRPLLCGLVVLSSVFLVHLRDLSHQGIIRVRVRKQGAEREKHLRVVYIVLFLWRLGSGAVICRG